MTNSKKLVATGEVQMDPSFTSGPGLRGVKTRTNVLDGFEGRLTEVGRCGERRQRFGPIPRSETDHNDGMENK